MPAIDHDPLSGLQPAPHHPASRDLVANLDLLGHCRVVRPDDEHGGRIAVEPRRARRDQNSLLADADVDLAGDKLARQQLPACIIETGAYGLRAGGPVHAQIGEVHHPGFAEFPAVGQRQAHLKGVRRRGGQPA
ncbi:hypothetical protein D3C72_1310640 [compost metagenome]